jgi:hypothetical protein
MSKVTTSCTVQFTVDNDGKRERKLVPPGVHDEDDFPPGVVKDLIKAGKAEYRKDDEDGDEEAAETPAPKAATKKGKK